MNWRELERQWAAEGTRDQQLLAQEVERLRQQKIQEIEQARQKRIQEEQLQARRLLEQAEHAERMRRKERLENERNTNLAAILPLFQEAMQWFNAKKFNEAMMICDEILLSFLHPSSSNVGFTGGDLECSGRLHQGGR